MFACSVPIIIHLDIQSKFEMFSLIHYLPPRMLVYNGHGSSKKGAVNLCKMFRQITEAWESAPVDLKLGKVWDSLFISYNTKNTNCRPLCVLFS